MATVESNTTTIIGKTFRLADIAASVSGSYSIIFNNEVEAIKVTVIPTVVSGNYYYQIYEMDGGSRLVHTSTTETTTAVVSNTIVCGAKTKVVITYSAAFSAEMYVTGLTTMNAIITTRDSMPQGIITYTEPYRRGSGSVIPFSNPTYGFEMNKNGVFTGTPSAVHNGTDAVQWTGSNITGANFVFDSTTVAHAGTKSISGIASTDGDEAQLAGVAISSANYLALTGWIYITAWPTTGTKEVHIRPRLTGVNVGTEIALSQKVSVQLLNTWQKFTILMSEFTSVTTNINQLVIRTEDISAGAAPDYYLDDLQWEQTGGSLVYTAAPQTGTIYRVFNLTLFGVSNTNSTLLNSSHQNVAYNKFFGITKLGIGLISATTINGVLTFSGVFQQHADLSMLPETTFSSGGDGTNTWWRYDTKFSQPIELNDTTGDNLQFIVVDDLSTLLYFRIFTNGVTETLVPGENAP